MSHKYKGLLYVFDDNTWKFLPDFIFVSADIEHLYLSVNYPVRNCHNFNWLGCEKYYLRTRPQIKIRIDCSTDHRDGGRGLIRWTLRQMTLMWQKHRRKNHLNLSPTLYLLCIQVIECFSNKGWINHSFH